MFTRYSRRTDDVHRNLLKSLEGITVASMTPLTEEKTLDRDSLYRLIEHLISGGASCIFPLGWAGELPLLTDEVRKDVLKTLCSITNKRVPVMAGVAEQSIDRAKALVEEAEKAGADIILSTMPYSYSINDELIFRYFEELTALSDLPLVIYDNGEIGRVLGTELLRRLSLHSGIIGVKASLDFHTLRDYYFTLDDAGGFQIISGDEFLFGPALFLGIRHFTMGGPGNFAIRYCTTITSHAAAGEWKEAQEKEARLYSFCSEVYSVSDSPYAVSKYVMKNLGIMGDTICSPHRMLTKKETKKADTVIDSYRDVLSL